MLFDIVHLLIESAASLLAFCLLLRALMQSVRLHPRNPLAPFTFAMTDWLVRPLRRAVPGFGGIDWASLLGALLVAAVLNIVLLTIRWLQMSDGFMNGGDLAKMVLAYGLPAAFVWLLRNSIYLLMGIVLIQAVLSWVNPLSPLSGLLNELSHPFIAPLRRVVPTVGNVDLSPLVLLLILQILLMVLQQLAATLLSG
ncbi:MAG: YggT family protein [Burkholderiaceae bacterium]|jgi:YggT family protein